MKKKYDLYKNGKLIKTGMTPKDLYKFFDVKVNPNRYIRSGKAYRGEYTFGKHNEVTEEVIPELAKQDLKPQELCQRFTPQMLAEWRAMNRRYGRDTRCH